MKKHDHEPQDNLCDTIDTSPYASIQKAIVGATDGQIPPNGKVKRPSFSPRNGIIKTLVTLLALVGLSFIFQLFSISPLWLLPCIAIIVCFTAKKAVIWLVLFYQRYAPESVRASCLFTPTCSEYMLLSIAKYGFFKGIWKGIRRLLRCHYPNGGIDYP